jgi:hypothetical protein
MRWILGSNMERFKNERIKIPASGKHSAISQPLTITSREESGITLGKLPGKNKTTYLRNLWDPGSNVPENKVNHKNLVETLLYRH